MNALAEKRKKDRSLMPPHAGIGDYHNGIYDEHDYVSPWSISANNLDSDILVFLQDWTSQDKIAQKVDDNAKRFGFTPTLPSNKNLINLIQKYLGKKKEELYITNLFVFVKPGGISSAIPKRDMDYCVKNYAIPQIDIICPKLVICLGANTYNSLRTFLGEKPIKLSEIIHEPAIRHGKSKIYGVSHTGARGVANAGGMAGIITQWEMLRKIYMEL
jgi:restriction system protein